MTTLAPSPATSGVPSDTSPAPTDLRQNVDHLRRALQQTRAALTGVEAERDALRAAMRQLTTPVIPVAADIVVLPLLGDARAQQVQAESLVLSQATHQAQVIDEALSTIGRAAEELADCARSLFDDERALALGRAWDARSAMFRSTEGQLVNGPADLLSVFVPNWATVDDALLDELNVVAALGPLLKVKSDRDQHTLCTYIFAEHCRYMCMYPNSDPDPEHPGGFLADEFVPDFGLVGDPVFWTIADERANPERIARWTAAYADNAGAGLMVSAIAPIYVGAAPTARAMIGIDVTLDRIEALVTAAARGAARAVVLVDGNGRLVVASELATQLLGLPRVSTGARGASLDLDLASATSLPAQVVTAMGQGETGVEALQRGGGDYIFAYAPVATVGWSLGIITARSNVSVGSASTFVDALIGGIERHRARVAVLDATGVVAIDTTTVQHIIEAVQTARLLGTTVFLAGITPAVAQMILALGVDLRHLRSFADLRTALGAATGKG